MIKHFKKFNKTYEIMESVRWYKKGKLELDNNIKLYSENTLLITGAKRGDYVICIKDVENRYNNGEFVGEEIHPIKAGEIKKVEGVSHSNRVYFEDTILNTGNYDGDCFVLYNQ